MPKALNNPTFLSISMQMGAHGFNDKRSVSISRRDEKRGEKNRIPDEYVTGILAVLIGKKKKFAFTSRFAGGKSKNW